VQQIRIFQQKTLESFGNALLSVRLRSTYQLYWSVIIEADMGGALFLICAMISLVTSGFMIHHLWLLSTGTTTNESFKWADIKDAIESGEIVILDQDDPFMYFRSLRIDDRENRVSRIVSLDPPSEEDDVETPAEETCRESLVRDIDRGARTWKQVKNGYASESRWENLIKGIKGGKVLPQWQRGKRRWWKKKD
jgi:hypothetical protein